VNSIESLRRHTLNVTVEKATDVDLVRWGCEMTMHGQTSKVSIGKMARAEHSPLRCLMYKVELQGIPSFVSTHLVRHKIGVEHFVKSMRDDLYINPDTVVDRNTPVNHGMLINAQALVQMARKRLCFKSHAKTVGVMRKLRRALEKVEPELAPFLVPECVYRGGMCPEFRECKPGLANVLNAYVNPYVEAE